LTGSPDRSIEQRIEEAVVRALKIARLDAATPLRMGSTPGWDSMGHMMVVLELEKEFNTRFPPYLLPQLVDIASIAQTLRSAT
jgi:acyl carrier protein